ncbi:MAG: substrate-binding domain-containing protein, partial [Pseudomonadota bacterium]
GLAPPFLISAGSVPVTMQEGATAMARLLSAHPETDAVVCVSDLSAFGALVEAQRQGRVVPRDIAVAGFGGFEISAVCTPRITTVDARSHEIGAEVGRLLGHVLAGKAAPARRIELEPRLLVRESA